MVKKASTFGGWKTSAAAKERVISGAAAAAAAKERVISRSTKIRVFYILNMRTLTKQ